MTGQTIKQVTGNAPVLKPLTSPVTGFMRTPTPTMFLPLAEDALILRRYTPNWAAPDDRKVNPWDLNEPDPTDNGTMGTIPGVVIECNVGDTVVVHFRNRDTRVGKSTHERAHSLHPHGFVFDNRYDGAYPLSPPDPTQPVAAEASLWALLGVTRNKKGDRVPSPDPIDPANPHGGTFTYTWNTFGWPTTAGVWHYHDHSICDTDNINLGAIGIIVIHNPNDPDDIHDPQNPENFGQDLPGGSANGSPITRRRFPFPFPVPALPHDVNLFLEAHPPHGLEITSMPEGEHPMAGGAATGETAPKAEKHGKKPRNPEGAYEAEREEEMPIAALSVKRGDITLELADDLLSFSTIWLPVYRTPPEKALYLQLYHELNGVGMLINGRKYLGNTPTLVAGLNTKMRFGLVGMNEGTFHTFHLHGHRWVIPGPQQGNNPPSTIQNQPQIQAVSQFEDTKIFGPANSFSFTINQGSFMGSRFTRDPNQASGLGEWHMHCHVLGHMMEGMMGSLLIVQGGALALGLPSGEPCGMVTPPPATVVVKNFAFTPNSLSVPSGTVVIFDFQEAGHTVQTVSTTGTAVAININNGGGPLDAVSPLGPRAVTVTGNSGDTINYQCGIHLAAMTGTIHIS
jgi:FtsP/CotA-like multicopper oxidase with cupredoxin domain